MSFVNNDKVSGFKVIVHSVNIFMWINKLYWIHFRSMYFKGYFGGTLFWCVNIFVEVLGLDIGLWFFESNFSSVSFFLINNGPLKGRVSGLPKFFINTFPNSFLSSLHPIHSSFSYVGEKFFGIWKDVDWYCWPIFLFKNWRWFIVWSIPLRHGITC